jgi:hypothetical protein
MNRIEIRPIIIKGRPYAVEVFSDRTLFHTDKGDMHTVTDDGKCDCLGYKFNDRCRQSTWCESWQQYTEE